MKVDVHIRLIAHDALLMHKNGGDVFAPYVYILMDYYGCSRTPDELQGLTTSELVKDMWYLKMSYDSCMIIDAIDDALLNAMLFRLNQCGKKSISLDSIFHEYAEVQLESGEWRNIE